ncbi:uncharacterized protein CLUP02_09140 [Colletotrichum lupini]|uniref:G domain-containing protein n=1 Tax=Colletotrichum lupini TaxID=145971 RepID=A0A9Q8WIA9_9PEZI|nr:uncharacterized protein CLUP02_09140 [Colletotrichum lupini]UQC83645.1 hypothetical protein CLUP02_09140 [Colletotrichum lupini]
MKPLLATLRQSLSVGTYIQKSDTNTRMKILTIAVIGPRGCGKTTFIRSLFENAGDYVAAQDDDISIHTANLDDQNLQMHLIDTPCLSPDKRHLPDVETLNYIKTRLKSTDTQIDGVIYLQRIMDLSNADYAARNLDAFLNAFKSRGFRHVVVAATNWDRVTSEADSSALEGYFHDHLDRESLASSLGVRIQRARLSDSTDASWDLLESMRYVETPEPSPPPSPPPPTPASPLPSSPAPDASWVPGGHDCEGPSSAATKDIRCTEAPFERSVVQASQDAS